MYTERSEFSFWNFILRPKLALQESSLSIFLRSEDPKICFIYLNYKHLMIRSSTNWWVKGFMILFKFWKKLAAVKEHYYGIDFLIFVFNFLYYWLKFSHKRKRAGLLFIIDVIICETHETIPCHFGTTDNDSSKIFRWFDRRFRAYR